MGNENPFDREVEEYEEWFKTNDQLLKSEVEAIRQLLPNGDKRIEIGVGTGIFASKLGINYGVEPSTAMAEKALSRGIHVLKGTAENLPLEDASFDLALMVTVDCFLEDVPKAFQECYRILQKTGVFIIAFLDKATPLGEQYEKNKHLHKSYRHANFHTAEEIIEMLSEAGFTVRQKKQTIFSLDNQHQEVEDGLGQGVFAVIRATK